jgi:hypothetical protein
VGRAPEPNPVPHFLLNERSAPAQRLQAPRHLTFVAEYADVNVGELKVARNFYPQYGYVPDSGFRNARREDVGDLFFNQTFDADYAISIFHEITRPRG